MRTLAIGLLAACSPVTQTPGDDAPDVDASLGVDGGEPDGPGAFRLEDGLRGATLGNPVGGSIGPDGWTVTGPADRLWYALPRLARGSIEFTVTNMSNANLVVNDNEILALY